MAVAVNDSSDVIGHFVDQGVYRYWINSLVDVEGNPTFYMFFVDISTGEYSVKSTYTMR